ncbi:MAG: type IIL restriction-modification enzyme MmeI, partial [Aggregatilineales bacterium]
MEMDMNPQKFVRLWRNTALNERQSYTSHFMALCELVNFQRPDGTGKDQHGNTFLFEQGLKKLDGSQGYADVYYQNHFAIEYKAPGKYKDLSDAYQQLLQYREKLNNPPLLIVTDIDNWQIHTNYPNTEKKVYEFTHEQIASDKAVQDYLDAIFYEPMRLHPNRNTAQITAEAAKGFQLIVDNMREKWQADPERIAHFLTKLIFCLFAEDVELLPKVADGQGIFSEIIRQTYLEPDSFVHDVDVLFRAMANGGR